MIRKVNALIAYYFKINPDTLDDEEWMENLRRIEYLIEIKAITGYGS